MYYATNGMFDLARTKRLRKGNLRRTRRARGIRGRDANSGFPRHLDVPLDLYPPQATMRRWNIRIYKLVTVINPEQSDQHSLFVSQCSLCVRTSNKKWLSNPPGATNAHGPLCGGHVPVSAPGLAKTGQSRPWLA